MKLPMAITHITTRNHFCASQNLNVFIDDSQFATQKFPPSGIFYQRYSFPCSTPSEYPPPFEAFEFPGSFGGSTATSRPPVPAMPVASYYATQDCRNACRASVSA